MAGRSTNFARQLISGVTEAVGVNVAVTCFDIFTAGTVRGIGIGGTTDKRKRAGKVALAAAAIARHYRTSGSPGEGCNADLFRRLQFMSCRAHRWMAYDIIRKRWGLTLFHVRELPAGVALQVCGYVWGEVR